MLRVGGSMWRGFGIMSVGIMQSSNEGLRFKSFLLICIGGWWLLLLLVVVVDALLASIGI